GVVIGQEVKCSTDSPTTSDAVVEYGVVDSPRNKKRRPKRKVPNSDRRLRSQGQERPVDEEEEMERARADGSEDEEIGTDRSDPTLRSDRELDVDTDPVESISELEVIAFGDDHDAARGAIQQLAARARERNEERIQAERREQQEREAREQEQQRQQRAVEDRQRIEFVRLQRIGRLQSDYRATLPPPLCDESFVETATHVIGDSVICTDLSGESTENVVSVIRQLPEFGGRFFAARRIPRQAMYNRFDLVVTFKDNQAATILARYGLNIGGQTFLFDFPPNVASIARPADGRLAMVECLPAGITEENINLAILFNGVAQMPEGSANACFRFNTSGDFARFYEVASCMILGGCRLRIAYA
ncbi:hypothetical protein PFISCL1PPCAC_6955, partial [Pristionchus fissidentatus]